LQRLHRAVVAKCDADDGLADGLIGDPLRCKFDPRTVVCGKTPDSQCLSSAAVDAAAQLYAGPPNPGNVPSGTTGLLPGSELQWAVFLGPKNLAARWAWGKAAAPVSRDASAVDLSAFAAAKGKLIIYQGLADPLVSPLRTIRYYEMLAKSMKGIINTQGSVRLFAVPGMNHCAGGEGAHRINFLSVLENWAAGRSPDDVIAFKALAATLPEHPFAPEALDGAQAVVGGWMLGGPVSLEQARQQSASALSRPVFLYPYRTQYKGRGDPRLWMNFFSPGDTAFLFN
jgi:feruloyl esterase